MKFQKLYCFVLCLILIILPTFALSEESEIENDKNTIYQMGEMQVTGKAEKPELTENPEKSIISLDNFKNAGMPQNIGDIVKDLVIIDYRGASNLIPDDDTLYMRGFSSQRFVTALQGSTIRKTGGRRSSHIVDYALLPPFLIESVEVLPGPHSALYPGKGIGGVLNFVIREPVRYDTLKPDLKITMSYSTYDTQTHSASFQGSIANYTYDLGYQKYATDGYLRHSRVDIDTVFGRFSYLLPNNGYITVMGSYADADRNRPTVNDPYDSESQWDSHFPVLEKAGRIYYSWQNPTWDKISPNFRMNLKLPTPIGTWTASGYYGEENRDNSLMVWIDNENHSQGIKDGSWDTQWHQQGGKIANEFELAQGHVTTIGADLEQCYDGYGDVPGWDTSEWAHDDKKRIEIISGFAQHKWTIIPRLKLTMGLRYEDATIWISNFSSSNGSTYITGREMWIERNWSEWSPKSFLTYELDDLAHIMRDTSVSLGVSKIWRAPDYHGDYNPQGRPTGAWLEPEHGVGYDAVFKRRLIGDIQMKLNYAYYRIKDYVADNSSYAQYSPSKSNIVEPGMEYMDYKINLEEVLRQGVEVQFSGHMTEKLSFLFGYAWQDFENQGNEPAGETELDDRPANQVNGKLTYQVHEDTSLTLAYEYQDEQIILSGEEVASNVYDFEEIPLESFHLFDVSIQHNLFKKWKGIQNAMVRIYINNCLNEDYENTSGYPATSLTVGSGISFQL